MTNLDTILTKREKEKQLVNTNFNESLIQTKTDNENRINALKQEYEQMITALQIKNSENLEVLKESYNKKKKGIDLKYDAEAADAIVTDLSDTYSNFLKIEAYMKVPEEKVEDIIAIKNTLKQIENIPGKEAILRNFPKETIDILNSLPEDYDIQKIREIQKVNSYFACNTKSFALILPSKDKNTSQFANDLEGKVLDILNVNREIKEGTKVPIYVNDSIDYQNDFLVLSFNSDSVKEAAKKVIERLNSPKAQPESFTKYNLIHKIIPIDYEIFEEFVNKGEKPEQLKFDNEYLVIKEKYDALGETHGKPLTRTDLNKISRPLWDDIRDYEKKNGQIDFLKRRVNKN